MGSVEITTLDRTVIGEEPFAGDGQSTHIGPVDRIGSMVDLDTVRRTSRRGDGTYLAVIWIERKNRSGTDQKDVDFASHRSGPSITLTCCAAWFVGNLKDKAITTSTKAIAALTARQITRRG